MKFASHNPVKCTCSRVATTRKPGPHFCKKHRCYVKNGKRDRVI